MISNYIRKCIIILKQKQKQKKIIIERNPGSFVVEVESRIGRVPFDWYHSIVVELNLVVFAWFHVKNPRFPSKEQETSQFVSEETPFSSMVIKLAHQFLAVISHKDTTPSRCPTAAKLLLVLHTYHHLLQKHLSPFILRLCANLSKRIQKTYRVHLCEGLPVHSAWAPRTSYIPQF